jgi:chromosome segregation ATPase
MMQDENEIVGMDVEVKDTPVVEDAADETSEDVSEDKATEADAEDGADDGGEIDKEMKTIKKALNKKNRYIDNQRARIRALEAEMQKLTSQQNKAEAPEMDKFDSVLDWVDAKQTYNLDQKLQEQAQQQQLAYLQNQQAMVRQQQAQVIEDTMTELLSSNPDVKAVITQNAQVIQSMPPHIGALMFEIDNAPAATYALAKEGRLQDLYFMPPHIAAAHLVQAEIRGQQYLQQSAKPPKQAPQPIGPLKGAGKSSNRPLEQRSPDELMKWLNT